MPTVSAPALPTTPRIAWGRWIPWVGSAGLVLLALSSTDLDGVQRSLAYSPALSLFGVLALFSAAILVMEAFFLQSAICRLERPVDFIPVFRARSAATLLTAVSTLVGWGGLVLWLRRRLGISARRGLGIMLIEAFHELGSMGLLAAVSTAIVLGSTSVSPDAWAVLSTVCTLATGVSLFFFGVIAFSRIPRQNRPHHAVLTPFADLKWADYGALLAVKLVQNCLWGLSLILALPLCAIHAPAWASLAYTQVIHLARALPISAFGIGADQVTIATLFQPWESTDGALVAFSLLFTTGVLLCRVLLGLPFVAVVLNEIRRSKNGEKP